MLLWLTGPPISHLTPKEIDSAVDDFRSWEVWFLAPAPPGHRVRIAAEPAASWLRNPLSPCGQSFVKRVRAPQIWPALCDGMSGRLQLFSFDHCRLAIAML
jgi:hypothetical protein